MVFSPNTIKSSFNIFGQPASPARYLCVVGLPPALLTGGGALDVVGAALGLGGAAQVSLMAEACSIPGRGIATTPFTMYGTTQKMPYGSAYADLNITFICTGSMVERVFFDVWHQFIHNTRNNYMNYYDTYVSTVIIKKVEDSLLPGAQAALSPLTYWRFDEAFPVEVQAQELGYAQGDTYLRLNVQFAYRKWSSGVDDVVSALYPGE